MRVTCGCEKSPKQIQARCENMLFAKAVWSLHLFVIGNLKDLFGDQPSQPHWFPPAKGAPPFPEQKSADETSRMLSMIYSTHFFYIIIVLFCFDLMRAIPSWLFFKPIGQDRET